MKRDMDLIRQMLLALEQRDQDGEERAERKDPTDVEGYSQQERMYNAALIIESGLAKGDIVEGAFGKVMCAGLDRLTVAGHDFLDAARDDTIWKKAKEKVMKPGAAFTFEIVKEWLKVEIRSRIGGA
jgi:hypothetical protein